MRISVEAGALVTTGTDCRLAHSLNSSIVATIKANPGLSNLHLTTFEAIAPLTPQTQGPIPLEQRVTSKRPGTIILNLEAEAMTYSSINFKDKLAKFSQHWSPRVIAEMNDYQFKLVKLEGEFVWHNHPATDETFVVLEGEMAIEFRDGRVELKSGEMFVVPKGIEHKPVATHPCSILLIEPRGVINTGDAEGPLKAPNDVWV